MFTVRLLPYLSLSLVAFAAGALCVLLTESSRIGKLSTSASRPAQVAAPAASDAELKQQVSALEAEVSLLTRKLDQLTTRPQEQLQSAPPSAAEHMEAFTALKGIRLGKSPTRDQVAEYVQRIMRVTRSQNSYSGSDPHIEMLAQVGPKHLDVLLANGDESFYVPAAVAIVATEAQKQQVIAALPKFPELITAITKRGWQTDAKPTLIAELRKDLYYLPPKWIEAVAEFRDPETYPLLRRYLVKGLNPGSTYDALCSLNVDLDEWVAEAWRRRQLSANWSVQAMTDDNWSGLEFAAAQHGQPDALARLFEVVRNPKGEDWRLREALAVVARVTEARGSHEQLVAWYESAKQQLLWDPQQRKYTIGPSTRSASPLR